MAELNGTDTEEFLADLYAKASRLQKLAETEQEPQRVRLNVNPEAKHDQ